LIEKVMMHVLDTQYTKDQIPVEMQGQETHVEYTAPLARTQRARQLDSTVTFLQLLQTLAQADPTILSVLKKENLVANITDLLGVPYWILKTADELATEKAQAAQQQQMQQMMEMAPAASQALKSTTDSVKNLAQTAQIGVQGAGEMNLR
jgi:hypothetical protein